MSIPMVELEWENNDHPNVVLSCMWGTGCLIFFLE